MCTVFAFKLFSRPKSFPIVRAPFRSCSYAQKGLFPSDENDSSRPDDYYYLQQRPTKVALPLPPKGRSFFINSYFLHVRTSLRSCFDFFFSSTPRLRLQRSYSAAPSVGALEHGIRVCLEEIGFSKVFDKDII